MKHAWMFWLAATAFLGACGPERSSSAPEQEGTRFPLPPQDVGPDVQLSCGVPSEAEPEPAAPDPEPEQPYELRVPVLMYHRITCPPANAPYPELYVCPARFREHLERLKSDGWVSITSSQLARAFEERQPLPANAFVISVDDGSDDAISNGLPVLNAVGMKASFYVYPGSARDSWKLSFAEMRRLLSEGHGIENHTLNHKDLTTLSGAALSAEVEGSQVLFEKELGFRPMTFAYPYGANDEEARAAVAASGFTLAFTTASGALQSAEAPLQSPRVRVNGSDTAEALAKRMRLFVSGK